MLGKDKDALSAFSRRQLIPFDAFEDVPESSEGEVEERPFLLCHYNRTENSHRSPWTNRYYVFEKTSDGEEIRIYEKDVPEEEQEIRLLETAANDVWESYVQLYYGKEAVGSVFLRPKENGAFDGLFGVKKAADNGSWDSVHLVKVDAPNETDKTCDYHLESAVTVSLEPYEKSEVSCSLTKDTSKTCKVRYASLSGSHLENLGKIIEDVEIDFRSRMERVDIPKTMEVIESVYRKNPGSMTAHLMNGGGAEPSHATGMGVGSGMIGEIANRAKAKMGSGNGPSPFMAAMKSNLAKRNSEKKDGDGTGGQYVDLKMGLKKKTNPLAGEAMATHKQKQEDGRTFDLKNTLKKTGSVRSQTLEPTKSPTPEFMDFRNKLKKSNK